MQQRDQLIRGVAAILRIGRRSGWDCLTMTIAVHLGNMLARRCISLTELSEAVDITLANLSILKTGKAKAVRFSTVEAICAVLDCQLGNILSFQTEPGKS